MEGVEEQNRYVFQLNGLNLNQKSFKSLFPIALQSCFSKLILKNKCKGLNCMCDSLEKLFIKMKKNDHNVNVQY
jgi:hypothetical protein